MEKDYLAQGSQTILTPRVYDHAQIIQDSIPNGTGIREQIVETNNYIFNLPLIEGYHLGAKEGSAEERQNRELKNSVFRKRDLDQILKEGPFPTCSDIGVLFRGLMIAQNIATAYVETFNEEYLNGTSFHTHSFGRVFTDEGSLLVNPGARVEISENEEGILPYVIVDEGLDSWDLGIYGAQDLHNLRKQRLPELKEKFERIKKNLEA